MNMYAYFKKNFFWFFVFFIVLLSGSTATLGYLLARSHSATREINAKYTELQRSGDEAEAAAETGYDIDTELNERAGANKRRIDGELEEVSSAGEGLTQELQEIITESQRVKYRRVDNGVGGCYYVVGAADLESD